MKVSFPGSSFINGTISHVFVSSISGCSKPLTESQILVMKLILSEEPQEIFQKGAQIQHEIHQFRFGKKIAWD